MFQVPQEAKVQMFCFFLPDLDFSLTVNSSSSSSSGHADVSVSQRDHHCPRQLHTVHHLRQLHAALAGDRLQHVHLRVPLPTASDHHDLLLHTDSRGDLQPDGSG